jgi:hypothetical protein
MIVSLKEEGGNSAQTPKILGCSIKSEQRHRFAIEGGYLRKPHGLWFSCAPLLHCRSSGPAACRFLASRGEGDLTRRPVPTTGRMCLPRLNRRLALARVCVVSTPTDTVAKALVMASAQQLIGLVKSHAEGNEDRFFDLALQLAAAEAQKGHTRLAEQLRQWAEAGRAPPKVDRIKPTPLAAPRGDLAGLLSASYPTTRLADVILPAHLEDELAQIVTETRMTERLGEKGLQPRRRLLLAGPPGTGKTMSAAALAGDLKFPLFTVLLHGLITKFMGETAQKLRMLFDAVRTARGVYLLMRSTR